MNKIEYKKGYKYQVHSDCVSRTCITGYNINLDYIRLEPNGNLTNKKGYAWDGASGPTFDTKSSIRGSAAHDALYQLIRLGYLPPEMRVVADDELARICIEDGMWKLRAKYWETAVHKFGMDNIFPSAERPVLVAP